MSKGWISLHRELQGHWLWQEKRGFSKLEAWLDILLTVNHSDQKVMIKNTLYEVKRGESIKCLDTWGKRWNWNKSKVRRFFMLLEKDGMIRTKNETKTTRLTVCKYDSYQQNGNENETQMKQSRNADETQATPNNNDNNINNDEVRNESLHNIDKLIVSYLSDERLCNAVIGNKANCLKNKEHLIKRLDNFKSSLFEQGRYSEKWSEFTKYFLNWNKKTIVYEDEILNTEKNEYKEKDFITNWHRLRSAFKMRKIKLDNLSPKDKELFNKCLYKYSKEDINNALKGLFKQENKTFTSNYIDPTHFLNNINRYLNAELSKDYELYGTDKTKPNGGL